MNCEEVEELAGVYAFGALPEARAAVAAHLASCDRHPGMRELEALTASLALAAEEMEPPPALKSRLMEAIQADTRSSKSATGIPIGAQGSLFDAIRGWFASPRFGYGLSAALAVAVVGLLAWNITLQGSSSNHGVINFSGTASGRLIYLQGEQLAVMDIHGLAPLSADKVYEVWAITPDSAIPIGLLTPTAAGNASLATSLNATSVAQVAVTIEPAPGSDQPTTPPVILGNFS